MCQGAQVKQEMETIGTKLGNQMIELINEYGITAVTSALINEVESHENWRQTENLKRNMREYIGY